MSEGKFRSQKAVHNWLKQGKTVKIEWYNHTRQYYRFIKGKLHTYPYNNSWEPCIGDLSYWFRDGENVWRSSLKEAMGK